MIVGYIRASTGKQIRTLEAQRDVIERYAAMRQWTGIEYIEDAATSGGMPFAKRPGGASIMDMVRDGKVEAVILPTLDRGFRVCSDALVTVDTWAKHKVALCVADFNGAPIDTSSPIGKMLLTMLAAFAEFEKARIAERTSIVLQQARDNGEIVYNPQKLPFGYMPDPYSRKVVSKDGNERYSRITISPDEQETKAMILDLRKQGLSYDKIVAHLKSEKRKRWNGQAIRLSTVRDVIYRQ